MHVFLILMMFQVDNAIGSSTPTGVSIKYPTEQSCTAAADAVNNLGDTDHGKIVAAPGSVMFSAWCGDHIVKASN